MSDYKPKLYFVNQLGFSSFLSESVLVPVVGSLSEWFEVIEPFAEASEKLPEIKDSMSLREYRQVNEVFADEVGKANFEACEIADVIAAVLDGSADCDSGSCVELGYVAALHSAGKSKARIVALRADFRGCEPGLPVNLQVLGAIKRTGGVLLNNYDKWLEYLHEECRVLSPQQ